MFFSGNILNLGFWMLSVIAFFVFSFAASSIYCFNDLRDREADRLHPVKKNRPIASGRVSAGTATTLACALVVAALAMCFLFPAGRVCGTLLIVFAYLVLNVLYSLKLKQIAIIDVMIIAFGFVLRLMLGSYVCGIWLSPWIVCLTFLLTLFMAFAKRRDDVVILMEKNIVARRNVRHYNLAFMNQTLGILAAVTIVCYIMYCLSPEVIERMGTEYLYVSAIFVIAAILRYLQITLVKSDSGSPTRIVTTDRFLQAMIALWLVTFVVILYI